VIDPDKDFTATRQPGEIDVSRKNKKVHMGAKVNKMVQRHRAKALLCLHHRGLHPSAATRRRQYSDSYGARHHPAEALSRCTPKGVLLQIHIFTLALFM